jgi:hypothetical protein
MLPNMSPDAWNLRIRVRRAIRAIQDLSEQALANVIWSRIKGEQDPRLPRFERGEYPSDLFIDVIRNAPDGQEDLLRRIKAAAAHILVREVDKPELTEANAIAETIFLAASIGAETAINPIFLVAAHPDSKQRRLDTEELLRSRALRALLGLLIAFPKHATLAHQKLFEELMFERDCAITCLTALIGLFKQDRKSLTAQFESVDQKDLDLHLSVAGLLVP